MNLAQDQAFFDAAGLPHAASLALQGAAVDLAADPEWLAQYLTDFGFDRALYTYEVEGVRPLPRAVQGPPASTWAAASPLTAGAGLAADIDGDGRLVVQTDGGETRVFTGEVSVQGIYGRRVGPGA